MDLKERILENWALTYKSKQRIFTAKTENDLKHIIKFAHKNKLQISIKGSGQSYNEQSFVKNGVTIDMIAMNRINTIDINNKWLIVQSGCLISEALKIIILKGFTIGAIPGSDKVSFGGAFINFVHGKDSKTFGSFINNIIEIKVILTNGKIKVIKRKNIPKILSFGLFFIVISLKIKLVKIRSNIIKTEKFFFDNINEMTEIIKSKQADFQYGWMNLLSSKNYGFIEVGNFYQRKKKVTIKKKSIFEYFLKFDFFIKYFVNNFFVKIFNKLVFISLKKKKINYLNLYDYYYPLKNIPLNRFFKDGIIELQIVLKINSFQKNFVYLKKILNEHKIDSFFTGIKYQKFQNIPLSIYQEGISFSIVFHNKNRSNKKFIAFIQKLNESLNARKFFINYTKDFILDSYSISKKDKRFFIKTKNKFDKQNLLYSDFFDRFKFNE